MTETVKHTIEALNRHGMGVHYVQKKEEVLPALQEVLQEGDSVGTGGSMSLKECGVTDFLKTTQLYSYLDRDAEGADPEEVMREVFTADAMVTGTNAITENGELVNMDGNGNRVAAMIYGPNRVVVVASVDKIVKDVPAARKRIADIAAPKNAQRLHSNAPCAVDGKCHNCRDKNPNTLCSDIVVQGMQRRTGRIQVILVEEKLGY